MISPLDRKLFRELWQQWGQLSAIALVVACGIAFFVLMRSGYHSLNLTQRAYYEQYRFGEVFAELKRAPQRLEQEIAAIEGVAQVQTRIVADVTLGVPELDEPASGRLISLPKHREGMLNDLFIRHPGESPDPQHPEEVLVSEAFANVNNLKLQDQIGAILNGHWQALQISGIALSPEYIYAVSGSGSLYPDDQRFGIIWMNESALANAFDLDGAFNSVALTLMPGANETAVIAQLDNLLDSYGGLGAYGRDDQVSHRIISDEIKSLEVSAIILPTLFLAIAAFLLHVLLSRLIATQRQQIAVLKAFGYSNWQVGWHYLKFILVVFSLGAILGVGLGWQLGYGLTQIYTDFFHFPLLRYEAGFPLVVAALLVSGGAACIGGLMAVRSAIALPPAQGMRPEPPATFRPTLIEQLGLQQFFSPAGRIILRNLERRPVRASLSILGIAVSVAILLTGFYLRDALDWLMTVQFQVIQREDVTLIFNQPRSQRSLYDLNHLPGILYAEEFRMVPVRLRHQHYQHRLAITGLPLGGELRQLIDRQLHPVPLPPDGLVLTNKLAEMLHLQPGDFVEVEVLEGAQPKQKIQVTGLVDEMVGLSAYMNLEALNQMMREGRTISGAYAIIDHAQEEKLYRQLKETPVIEGVSFRDALIESFEEISGENMQMMTGILVIFSCIITFSVVYNSARIALSERGRELASLRIMGFTQTEIAFILLGEQAILTLFAIPVGIGFGMGLSALMVQAYDSELYRLPFVISRATYGFTTLTVIIAGLISGCIIYRQLQKLDLIAVLKTRE